MRIPLILAATALCSALAGRAQSKVFKDVNDEISSQVKIIRQDNSLVGYLAFTKLEKASEDSFNYRITIMDENLNDIGKVNFRDENLNLQGVAFEKDILCLAFVRSNVIGKTVKNKKELNAANARSHNAIVTQFLGLDGKIIQTNTINANVETKKEAFGRSVVSGGLKEDIQLINVPQKGFTCFYGDETDNYIVAFTTEGKQLWKKSVGKMAKGYYLLGSADGSYLLSKKEGDKIEGGFEIAGFSHDTETSFDRITLRDKQGNALKVLGFDNDPQTGKPYVTGMIINPLKNGIVTVKDATNQPYIGVFTFQINGPKKADVKQTYSYWSQDKSGMMDDKGRYVQTKDYAYFHQAFMDYKGDSYFAGSSIRRKTQWGTVAVATILSPLILVSPMVLMIAGTQKCRVTNAMLLKQSADGKLSFASSIPANETTYKVGKAIFAMYGPQRSFYKVNNADTKTDYLIVDDVKDIVIYNVTQGKVARTIPHKDGNIRTNVFPAKEGHVMVMEYNKKEKFTRVSIEAL